MSIQFDNGLGALLVLALFFYLVIYFTVKHAIIAAHTQMEENKKNVEAEVVAGQDQENVSKTEKKRRKNASVRSNTGDEFNSYQENSSIAEIHGFEVDSGIDEYKGFKGDSDIDEYNNIK